MVNFWMRLVFFFNSDFSYIFLGAQSTFAYPKIFIVLIKEFYQNIFSWNYVYVAVGQRNTYL